jgi:hypothetical protein
MLEGKSCAVMPAGSPVTLRVTAALKLKLAVVVSVTVWELPAETLMEVAEDAKENVGAGATVTEIAMGFFVAPLVAVMVAE